MLPIFGQTTTVTPGVTASFNGDNKLVLTGTDNNMSLSVNSNTGSAFQEPQISSTDVAVSKQSGYYSSVYAKADGVNITEPLKIDEWNDELNFIYKENGNSHSVAIDLDEKDYTFDELKQTLQEKIDAQVGTFIIGCCTSARTLDLIWRRVNISRSFSREPPLKG